MSGSDGYGCNNLSVAYVVIVLILTFILLGIELANYVSTMRVILFRPQMKVNKQFKTLFVIALTALLIESFCFVYAIFAWLECETEASDERVETQVILGLGGLLSIVAFALIYNIFALRLVSLFEGSAYAVSQCLQRYFTITTVILAFLIVLTIIFLAIYGVHPVSGTVFACCLLFGFASFIALLVIFVGKLRDVSKNQAPASGQSIHSGLPNGVDNSELSQTLESQLLNLGTIIVVCVGAALASTALIAVAVIVGSFFDSNYDSTIVILVLLLDACVNAVALSMQWSYGLGQKLYALLCMKCHKCCQKCLKLDLNAEVTISPVDRVRTLTQENAQKASSYNYEHNELQMENLDTIQN